MRPSTKIGTVYIMYFWWKAKRSLNRQGQDTSCPGLISRLVWEPQVTGSQG